MKLSPILALLILFCVLCSAELNDTDDIIILEKVKSGKWELVDLKDALTYQIGTLEVRSAFLAIDNDLKSSIYACKPCNGSLAVGSGWWKVILQESVFVAAVQLISTNNEIEANFLKDFAVSVTGGENKLLCGIYQTLQNVPISSEVSVVCMLPRYGNEVMIFRLYDSKDEPDKLSFAEFKLFSEKPQPDRNVNSSILESQDPPS